MRRKDLSARTRLGNVALSVAVVGSIALLSLTDPAHATLPFTRTCAQIDPSQGGTPFTFGGALDLTVVTGDRIRATDTVAGTISYNEPGGPNQVVASPAVFDVGPAQAGVWRFNATVNSVITCGVGGAIRTDKSDITNHLLNTLNEVGGSIFDPSGIPGTVLGGNGTANGPTLTLLPSTSFASEPGPFAPISGLSGPIGADAGLTALGEEQVARGFDFSVDLRSMNDASSGEEILGADVLGGPPYVAPSPWNAWVSGRYVDFDADRDDAALDGHVWSLTSGMSYDVSTRTTVGAFTRTRNGEVASDDAGAELDAEFFGGGLFLSSRSPGGMRVLLGGLFEVGDNEIALDDIRVGRAKGTFDSEQWTFEGRIDQRFDYGPYWIEPGVNVLYIDLERDAYTDSAGTVVPGSDITLGRLTYGSSVGTTISSGGGAIKPFARINGLWNFENEDDFVVFDGGVVANADAAINVGGGVEIVYPSGLVVTAAGDWFDFDNGLESGAFTGSVGVPLRMLGIGGDRSGGLLSLGFADRQGDVAAEARVTIPLGGAD